MQAGRVRAWDRLFFDGQAVVGDDDSFEGVSGSIDAGQFFREGVGKCPGHSCAAFLIEKIYHDGTSHYVVARLLLVPLKKRIVLYSEAFL